jgi:hypothetical protein
MKYTAVCTPPETTTLLFWNWLSFTNDQIIYVGLIKYI